MLRFQALASGSNGNCSVFAANEGAIIIDAGISRARTIEGLKGLNVSPRDVKHVLITHAHSDHYRGLPVLMDYLTNAKVLASHDTIEELKKLKKYDPRYLSLTNRAIPLYFNDSTTFGDFTINMFHADHDVAGSAAFGIQHEPTEFRLSYTTDTANIDSKFATFAKGSEIVFLESNHEFSMLQYSRRPYWLKQRIKNTHLNNRKTMDYLSEIINEITQIIYLGHLSDECNHPDVVARRIMKLKQQSDYENWEWVIATREAKSSLSKITSSLKCTIEGGVTQHSHLDKKMNLEKYFEEIDTEIFPTDKMLG